MSGYQPEPGDKVILTVRAAYSDGRFYLGSPQHPFVAAVDTAIVSVAPVPVELPSLPGAVIRAEIHGRTGPIIPLVLASTSSVADTPWINPTTDLAYASEQITRVVEVLFPGVES